MPDPDPPLMTTDEVAAFFRTSPATISYWRHTGYGPKGRKVGRRVLYDRSEVEAFWATSKDGTGRDTIGGDR